jgi:hypothetical protein
VDGTPVYDIKPYVHWDIPPEVDYDTSKLQLPDWVESKDDILPKVEFTKEAEKMLTTLWEKDYLSPLYPSKEADAWEAAMQTLKEILAQDPRSSHKGLSTNQRGSVSSEVYKLLFCRVEVEFLVQDDGAKVVGIHPAVDRQTGVTDE